MTTYQLFVNLDKIARFAPLLAACRRLNCTLYRASGSPILPGSPPGPNYDSGCVPDPRRYSLHGKHCRPAAVSCKNVAAHCSLRLSGPSLVPARPGWCEATFAAREPTFAAGELQPIADENAASSQLVFVVSGRIQMRNVCSQRPEWI